MWGPRGGRASARGKNRALEARARQHTTPLRDRRRRGRSVAHPARAPPRMPNGVGEMVGGRKGGGVGAVNCTRTVDGLALVDAPRTPSALASQATHGACMYSANTEVVGAETQASLPRLRLCTRTCEGHQRPQEARFGVGEVALGLCQGGGQHPGPGPEPRHHQPAADRR